jgi:hypothetical protein
VLSRKPIEEMDRQFDEFGRYRPFNLGSDHRWDPKRYPYLLWYELLAISPSYNLALWDAHKPGAVDKDLQPADFDRVKEVYADLGDVRSRLFPNWWGRVAESQFGEQADSQTVHLVGYTNGLVSKDALVEELGYYFEEEWEWQGERPTMVFAIPVGASLQEIAKGLNWARTVVPKSLQKRNSTARYPLVAKRFRAHAYLRDLWLVHYCALNPAVPFWEAGQLSLERPTRGTPPTDDDDDVLDKVLSLTDRENSTRRSLRRANILAENAARGIFPKGDECEHAIKFDYDRLSRLIHRRIAFQDERIEKFKQARLERQGAPKPDGPG